MTEEYTRDDLAQGAGPLVSVILPVYNGELYLGEAIDSILAQTYKDFELLIVDDGSKDGSRHILQDYVLRDPRVRVVFRENRGLANTLNGLIEMARGTWIARMDQDDIALPHRFSRQLEWLKSTGADICGSWVRRFGTWDKRIVQLRESDEAIKAEMLFSCPFAHPTVMMRAALVKELRYKAEWDGAEDYDLWERAVEAGWRMTNVPEVLLLYRVHASQISTAASEAQKKLTLEIQRRYWEDLFRKRGLDRSGVDEWFKTYRPAESSLNMDAVDAVLGSLLFGQRGEARDAILSHVTRLYLRVVAECPDVATRWRSFFPDLSWHKAFSKQFELQLLRIFRINPRQSRSFELLRKLHIILTRS